MLPVVTVFVCGLMACSAAPSKIIQLNDISKLQLPGRNVSTSIGGFNVSVGLGRSLNGNPARVLFAQAPIPDGTSVPVGLAGSARSGRGPKSQAHVGTSKKPSNKASAGKKNHAPTSNGPPDDFYDNEFNISKLQLPGDNVSASIGGFNASVGLGGSLNGTTDGISFTQARIPDGTSVSAGLAGSAGNDSGLKSQAYNGTAKESSAEASAGNENHAATSNGPPNDFNNNEFNISKLQLPDGNVSASVGGFNASVGLGGSLNGNPDGVLFAEDLIPDGTSVPDGAADSAGSGRGLTSQDHDGTAEASAVNDNNAPPSNGPPDDFYDNEFNGDNPNGTSVPLGLAGSAGSGRGLKSQDHDGTAKKSSTKVSAGKENHAPTSNGTPDDFNDNEFNALWNVESKDYSNRMKKIEQYEQLLRKYTERFPDADKNKLIKGLNSLRANFRKELKRIKDSEKSYTEAEAVVEPTLWYFEEMKFLIGQKEPSTSLNTVQVVDEEEQESEEVDNFRGTSAINTISYEDEPPKKNSRKLDETQELILLARKLLQQPQTEFEKIASAWVVELQKMEPQQQLFAKKAINDILFEGQMGTLRRHSVQINNLSGSSSPYSSVQLSPSIYHTHSHSLQEQPQHTPKMQQSSASYFFSNFQ